MPKCPSKACVCAALAAWQFVSVLSIIVCGVIFLKPYVRVARYHQTRCRVESSFYTTQFTCDPDEPCDNHCKSKYPCLLVHVSLNDSQGNLWTIALYTDDMHQMAVHDENYAGDEECSIRVCGRSHLLNRKAVEDFGLMYGQKGSFITCFYDPEDIQWGAVLKVTTPGMPVLHAMIWPTCSLMLGSLICVIFCHWCRKTIKDDKDDNATDALVDNKSDKSGSGRSDKGSNGSRDAKSSRENTPKKKSSSLPRLDIVAQRLATSGADDSPAPSPNPYRVCPSGSSSKPTVQKLPKSPSAPPLFNIPTTTTTAVAHAAGAGAAAAKVPVMKTRVPHKPKRTKLDKSLVSPQNVRLKGIKEEVTVPKEDIPLTVTVTEQEHPKDKDVKNDNQREEEADVWL